MMQDAATIPGARGASAPEREQPAAMDWREVGLALGGPLALGACVGLKADPMATVTMALALPVVFAGVVAVTLPGLYVGASMLGIAPRASNVGRAALGAARDLGVVMLGLAPATLFVAASLPSIDEAMILGTISVALAAMIGVRAFYHRLHEVMVEPRALVIFPAWMLLSIGLGWQFYLMALRLGGLM